MGQRLIMEPQDSWVLQPISITPHPLLQLTRKEITTATIPHQDEPPERQIRVEMHPPAVLENVFMNSQSLLSMMMNIMVSITPNFSFFDTNETNLETTKNTYGTLFMTCNNHADYAGPLEL